MKKVLSLALVATAIFGDTLLHQAQKLESLGQYKEAMLLYKEIALKDINSSDNNYSNSSIAEFIELEESEQRREEFAKKQLNFSDSEASESIGQILGSQFGLYTYNMNYLAPYSYQSVSKEGRKRVETKLQVSLRKPLSYNLLGFDESIEFGYTQVSWWQLYERSSPFRETNYSPEFFMLMLNDDEDSYIKANKIGLIHTSNGKRGLESRSWNRIYLKSFMKLGDFIISPTIWYRIPEKRKSDPNQSTGDDNPEILKYYGHGELSVIYPYKKNIFELKLRNNLRAKNRGYVELSWTTPFNERSRFNKYFWYMSLSNGYGDSLIDHDKHINRATIGIALSR